MAFTVAGATAEAREDNSGGSIGKAGCSEALGGPELMGFAPGLVLAAGPDKNLLRLVSAQGQIITTNFDFDRIAERGKAD